MLSISATYSAFLPPICRVFKRTMLACVNVQLQRKRLKPLQKRTQITTEDSLQHSWDAASRQLTEDFTEIIYAVESTIRKPVSRL